MPPGSSTNGWSVTGQQEQLGRDEHGATSEGVLVRFKTERGLNGTVWLPRSRYNPANVKAAILDQVGKMHAVQDLTG